MHELKVRDEGKGSAHQAPHYLANVRQNLLLTASVSVERLIETKSSREAHPAVSHPVGHDDHGLDNLTPPISGRSSLERRRRTLGTDDP